MRKNLRIIFRSIGVLALMIILFCYAMFQGGFVSWFLFYSFLPIGIYQLLFACYPLRTWQVYREIEQPVRQAGDEIIVKVHMKRRLPFPLLYCTFEENFPQSLMKEDTKKSEISYFPNVWKNDSFPQTDTHVISSIPQKIHIQLLTAILTARRAYIGESNDPNRRNIWFYKKKL